MTRFVPSDRCQPFLMPPDLRDWVPEDDLVHFIIEAVERVDMKKFAINHKGSGSEQYNPRMMLGLIIYCYANRIFASRKIEQATHLNVCVRFVAVNTHPDHDTICTFRRENFSAIEEMFLQVIHHRVRRDIPKRVHLNWILLPRGSGRKPRASHFIIGSGWKGLSAGRTSRF